MKAWRIGGVALVVASLILRSGDDAGRRRKRRGETMMKVKVVVGFFGRRCQFLLLLLVAVAANWRRQNVEINAKPVKSESFSAFQPYQYQALLCGNLDLRYISCISS
jgi:hypothetical protein